MGEGRKEEIIMATLELASQRGMAGVSMNMIADRLGIKKPSLYNHFASKEDLVREMYVFLRERAKKDSRDYFTDYGTLFSGKTALEILKQVVGGYLRMTRQKELLTFYKVLYSERRFQPLAAEILAEETEKMIRATKQLFYAMAVHGILHFSNADMSALSFALTVHGIMDYEMDKSQAEPENGIQEKNLDDYLDWFCRENAVKE